MEPIRVLKGGEETSRECPNCHSKRNWKDGTRENNFGIVQRFLCRDCGFRFSEKSYKDCQPIGSSQLCAILEAKKLETATEIKTVAGEKDDLLEYAWLLKKRGIADNTIAMRVYILGALRRKGANLNDVSSVETILATEEMTKAQKFQAVSCYRSYTKIKGISWTPIKVRYEPKQPFIPTNEELIMFIAGARGKELATFLQVIYATGARAGEACKLQWTDINVQSLTIAINNPEKNSRSRTITVDRKTITMIQALPNKHGQYIFNPNSRNLKEKFQRLRKKLAETHQNPRLLQIHLHTFRHCFARSMLRKGYKEKDVQYLLGHKSILSTDRYTNQYCIELKNEQYISATAKTVDEVCRLAEDGFSYFCEMEGVKIFRKPK